MSGVYEFNARPCINCKECGIPNFAKRVMGKYNAAKTCNDRCLSATGVQCECACGGKNHGAGHGIG